MLSSREELLESDLFGLYSFVDVKIVFARATGFDLHFREKDLVLLVLSLGFFPPPKFSQNFLLPHFFEFLRPITTSPTT